MSFYDSYMHLRPVPLCGFLLCWLAHTWSRLYTTMFICVQFPQRVGVL